MNLLSKFLKLNFLFLFILILLSIIGFLTLYSAAGGSLDPWASRHAIRFVICFIILLIIAFSDLKFIFKYSYIIFFICLLLLISVEIAGSFGLGAKRWIRLFGVSVQPSELMKVSIILALSRYYHELRFDRIGEIKNLLVPLFIILFPAIFIVNQPDLGTSIMVIVLGFSIMFFAGVRIWKFIISFFIFFGSLPFIWNSIKPYQQQRVLSFLDPESDPLGRGYQLMQSKIALGSGGLTGKGFLQGTQSYLEYLPEKQTDFIFTLIGEEFGFIGTLFILFLFIILIVIGYIISLKSNNTFSRILSVSITINLFLYVVLNMSMVTGLMPVVGVPLPLLSYGGTAMLSIMISFGLLMNIQVNQDLKKIS